MHSGQESIEATASQPAQSPTSLPRVEDKGSSTSSADLEEKVSFPQKLLNVGFGFALGLSALCLLVSAVYLFTFLKGTGPGIEEMLRQGGANLPAGSFEAAINGRLVLARVSLLSCGVSAGLSFGFLGFALFLLGIRKEMDVHADYEGFQVKIARMSPGVLIILISATLIGVCVTHETPFWYDIAKSDYTNSQKAEKTENQKTRDLPSPPRKDFRP